MVDRRPPRARRALYRPRLPLVGRDDDLARLADLIDRPTIRLLTISGLGGIGKTRLAFELALRCMPRRTPVVVEAASSSDAADVIPAIAEALELSTTGHGAAGEVAQALAQGPTLLVLDNLEHLPGVDEVVRSLLTDVPGLQIVATSRVPLGVAGEHVWRTRPLGLPDEDTTAAAVDARDVGAVRLFRSVAEATDDRFVLDDSLADVVAICDRLGGHPLAIELAAARLAHLGPAALRRELELRSSTMFETARPDVPERHRDLNATIVWSYEQLDDDTQLLFRRLAVFESWSTLGMIELFLTELTPSLGCDPLDALATLVDHHLVETVHDRHDTRYRLLPPIRDVARLLLRQDEGEPHPAFEAHDEAFHRLAVRCLATYDEPGEHLRVVELHVARHDLIAALDRALADGRATRAADLASAVGWLSTMRRVFDVHRERLDRAATMPDATRVEASSRMVLHGWRLVLHALSGSDGARIRELDRLGRPTPAVGAPAADAAQRIAQVTMLLQILRAFVLVHDLDAAAAAGDEAIAAAGGVDDRWTACADALAGMVANLRGEPDRALALGLGSLDRARRVGHAKTVVRAGMLLAAFGGDGIGDTTHATATTQTITLDELYEIAQRLRDPEVLDWLLPVMAMRAIHAGDIARAAGFCAESFAAPRLARADMGLMCAAVMVVMTAFDAPAEAARVHGMLSHHWHTVASHMLPPQRRAYRAALDGVRTRIGPDTFDAAVDDGARLGWSTALRELHRLAVAMAGAPNALVEAPTPTPTPTPATSVDPTAGTSAEPPIDSTGATPATPATSATPATLTPRELEVLRHLATGRTNREISGDLSLSVKTVMHHTTAIYRKLGVRGRTEAAAMAHRSGLLDEHRPA